MNDKQKLLVDITGDSGEKVSGPLAFEDGFAVVVVTETLPAGPKALSECRGQVITDLKKRSKSSGWSIWAKRLSPDLGSSGLAGYSV